MESRQVDCKCYMRSCYHIIPEKNGLCCFGCVTSSLLHGVETDKFFLHLIYLKVQTVANTYVSICTQYLSFLFG